MPTKGGYNIRGGAIKFTKKISFWVGMKNFILYYDLVDPHY